MPGTRRLLGHPPQLHQPTTPTPRPCRETTRRSGNRFVPLPLLSSSASRQRTPETARPSDDTGPPHALASETDSLHVPAPLNCSMLLLNPLHALLLSPSRPYRKTATVPVVCSDAAQTDVVQSPAPRRRGRTTPGIQAVRSARLLQHFVRRSKVVDRQNIYVVARQQPLRLGIRIVQRALRIHRCQRRSLAGSQLLVGHDKEVVCVSIKHLDRRTALLPQRYRRCPRLSHRRPDRPHLVREHLSVSDRHHRTRGIAPPSTQ